MTDSEKSLFGIATSGTGEDLVLWRRKNHTAGVNCQWLGDSAHNRGETPLLVALFNPDKRVFMGILKFGGDPAIEDSKGRCVLEILEDMKNLPDWVDDMVIDKVEQCYDRYLDTHAIKTDARTPTWR